MVSKANKNIINNMATKLASMCTGNEYLNRESIRLDFHEVLNACFKLTYRVRSLCVRCRNLHRTACTDPNIT